MVPQHQDLPVADIAHQPLALFRAHGDAFEIVITDHALVEAGIEIARLQSPFGAAHRHRVRRMRVDDGMGMRQVLVEHRMLGETGKVHRPGIVAHLVPVAIDLDEVGRGHLLPQQAIGIDQEGIVLARHAQGDVVIDTLAPAVMGEDAIGGGEFLPGLPFRFAAIRARRG